MYAVIETGGKQYRVSPGQTVEVELLPSEPGATVTLDRVLMVATDGKTVVGQPTIPGGAVVATVVGEGRGKKVIVFRYKSKKRYRRTTGHRQDYTYLTVTDIQAGGESVVSDEERRRYERQAERAVNRYERKLLAAFEALIGAIASETGVSPEDVDVVDVEDVADEDEETDTADASEAASDETPQPKAKRSRKKSEE